MALFSIGRLIRRDARPLLAIVSVSLLCSPIGAGFGSQALKAASDDPQPIAAAGPLLISEFRWRGPAGANDEFVEIYNNSDVSHTVTAASGTGYGIAASDGVTRCTIPNGTVIPPRGHYLCVNSVAYSLASYPAGTGLTATGDATFTTGIPDNAGIALFNNNSGGASYTVANRFDAVGPVAEVNANYKEGTGYPTTTAFSIDASFTRRLAGGCTGSAGGGNCTSVGLIQTTPGPTSAHIQDTDNNAADFIFVDTNGTNANAGQRLGAPGPQNLSSPIAIDGSGLAASKLDPCQRNDEPPNQVRDFTSDPANNSTFGTLDVRRTFTNASGVPITRLRFRVLDITTFPSISGVADLRPRHSTGVVVNVDRSPCGSGTSNIAVLGTTLEQPPSQPNGSGFNGSLSVNAIDAGSPLAAGASVDVRFLLGIQQTGAARFCAVAETVPATGSQIFCAIGPTNSSTTFTNASAITINDAAAASIYPSNIVVSGYGVNSRVTNVTVTLNNLNHTFPDDVDVLLVGPTGVKLILLSDSCGSTDSVNTTLTFSTTAASHTSDSTVCATGTYRPSNYGTIQDPFPAPAPVGPYLHPGPTTATGTLTAFNGLNPNGTWSLYIVDDVGADAGAMTGGWSLTLQTSAAPPVTSDFNGDRATDFGVYRPSTGEWFVQGQAPVPWGLSGDMPVAGDYNGDGKTDIAVYRPPTGHWFVQGQATVQWGALGDVPVPGDYNGAGSTERAVYRPSTGQWFVHNQAVVQWGAAGDIPVPGDYNGDLTTDVAVYRPSTGEWFVHNQAPVQWGVPGDIPMAGDYNGDLVTDFAVYRPSSGVWYVRNGTTTWWGLPGDMPVAGDYNGDGKTDIAVYRPATGEWFVQGQTTVQWGIAGDLPVPRPEVVGDVNGDGSADVGGYLGDFDGNGSADIAIYRVPTGEWFANGQPPVQWGVAGDIPVPGDYNGSGPDEYAVYRPSTGEWHVRGLAPVQWGLPGDVPIPGDYDGNGTTDRAVYRPSTGEWHVHGVAAVQWGIPGDVPVPGDYDGNGTTDIAVYRPSSGQWFVRNQFAVQWGVPGDVPVPGDYNGDGTTDVAVYRPSSTVWFVQGLVPVQWGIPGDLAVPGDFNGDGLTDIAVYRPSSGLWFVRNVLTVWWGVAGDIPASRAYSPR
jgi:subtilisin-like proprotein convertase family protein